MEHNYWTSGAGRSLSRRSILRGSALAGAGLAGAVLIGCGDDDDDGGDGDGGDGTGGDTTGPKRGGTINVATLGDTNALDPALHLSSADLATSLSHFENLLLRMHDFSLRPMLAESWQANDDLSAYTFKLREGVKFHHGKDFGADDVVTTYERLIDPDTGSAAAGALSDIVSIEAPDDTTVTFNLAGPNAFFPDTMSLYQGRVLPSDVDPASLTTSAPGTGPLVLDEFEPAERAVWSKNPNYWNSDLPYFDRLVMQYIPEPNQRLEAVKSGQVDINFPADPFSAADLNATEGVTLSTAASAGYLNMAMRHDREPFGDLRVRQAFQRLQDRSFIRDAALFGLGVDANDHPIPPSDPHWNENQTIVPFDPAEATKLLAAAGQEGMQIKLHTSTVAAGMVEMATAYKELAQEVGVTIDIVQAPEDSYWSEVWLTEPFTTVAWNGRNPDQALSIVYLSDADWNEAYYQNADLDSMIAAARGQEFDERKETYGKIQQLLVDEAVRLVPVFRPTLVAVRDRVQGVKAHPSDWLVLHDAWVDDA